MPEIGKSRGAATVRLPAANEGVCSSEASAAASNGLSVAPAMTISLPRLPSTVNHVSRPGGKRQLGQLMLRRRIVGPETTRLRPPDRTSRHKDTEAGQRQHGSAVYRRWSAAGLWA